MPANIWRVPVWGVLLVACGEAASTSSDGSSGPNESSSNPGAEGGDATSLSGSTSGSGTSVGDRGTSTGSVGSTMQTTGSEEASTTTGGAVETTGGEPSTSSSGPTTGEGGTTASEGATTVGEGGTTATDPGTSGGTTETTGAEEEEAAFACTPDPVAPADCGPDVLEPGTACEVLSLEGPGCAADCQPTTEGVPEWSVEEDGLIYDIAFAGNDDIVVGGHNSFDEILVSRYDASGAELWSLTWSGGIAGNRDEVYSVGIDGASDIVAVGYSDQLVGGGPFAVDPYVWVGKFDEDGNELWVQTWESPAFAETDGALGPNDEIIIVDPGYGGTAGTLTALDTDGAWQWEAPVPIRYEGAVAVNASGSIAVTGAIGGTDEIWVGTYDAEGTLLWEVSIPDANDASVSEGTDLAFDSEGNLIVAGQIATADASVELWLGKIDPDGCGLWSRTFGGPGVQVADQVRVDSQDRIIVGGEDSSAGAAIVARFLVDGGLDWIWMETDNEIYSGLSAVGVDSTQRVVSAGFTSFISGVDFTLVGHAG